MKLRILVADDSVLFRRVLGDVLAALPDVEVVGAVSNGKLALQRVRELRPDVLTLDIEMPQMDGLQLLDVLRETRDPVAVIVVSALTRKGGELTLRALEKGAFDFITKPDTADAERSRSAIRQELAPRLRALAERLAVRKILNGASPPARSPARPATPAVAPVPAVAPAPGTTPAAAVAPGGQRLEEIASRMNRLGSPGRPECVLIGVSTGGPQALARLLPALPGDLGVPVFVVQHMPPVFTQTLAESLASKCALRVREAGNGERPAVNTVYIAPGGKQMRLRGHPEGGAVIQITEDPPENNCRPSVDYLFRSAAATLPGRPMAVILTGMGSDGAVGLRLLRRHGCYVVAQNEASCVVYGMPRAAVEAGVVDAVLPLEAIAGRITAVVRGLPL